MEAPSGPFAGVLSVSEEADLSEEVARLRRMLRAMAAWAVQAQCDADMERRRRVAVLAWLVVRGEIGSGQGPQAPSTGRSTDPGNSGETGDGRVQPEREEGRVEGICKRRRGGRHQDAARKTRGGRAAP